MIWLWEGGTLLLVGLVLRHALHMGRHYGSANALAKRSTPRIDPIYTPLISEIEAHITILGVSLNDAFEEAKAGRYEAARCMVSIFASESNRLTGLIQALLQLAVSYLPVVELPIPVRNLDAHRFRSGTMIEFVRFQGFLDQFVFRAKLRFQLHLRLQRRAIGLLSEEFQRMRVKTEEDNEHLIHTLTQFDLYFHDLDLLAKETLLSFRSELSCLPEKALADIEVELEDLVGCGVLKPLSPVTR